MSNQPNRFCSQCGASIQADAKFCHACGAPVEKPEVAPIAPEPLDQQPPAPRGKRRLWLVIVIALLCLIGLTYAASYLSKQAQTELKPNMTAAGSPTVPPMLTRPAESATPEIRKAKPVSSPSLKGSSGEQSANAHETKTQSDPIAEYWKQYRGSDHLPSDAESAANLRAREAAARAKVDSEAATRRGEYLALVPHKVTNAWIAGIWTDKIGVDLLVQRGVTDQQLADLIQWYVGCNAKAITVYDDAENARTRVSMVASYDCGEANDCTQFERFTYTKGKDWTVTPVSF